MLWVRDYWFNPCAAHRIKKPAFVRAFALYSRNNAKLPFWLASDGIYRWCETTRNDSEISIITLDGLWLEAHNRNGNVSNVLVMPRQSSFAEMEYKNCD